MSSSSRSSGVGFIGLLTIVFITLKLTKYIEWSWWWVLSPLWIGIPATVIFAFGLLVLAAFLKSIER